MITVGVVVQAVLKIADFGVGARLGKHRYRAQADEQKCQERPSRNAHRVSPLWSIEPIEWLYREGQELVESALLNSDPGRCSLSPYDWTAREFSRVAKNIVIRYTVIWVRLLL